MKIRSNSVVRMAVLKIVAALLIMSTFSIAQATPNPGLKPPLSSLAFFTGDLECSGKFDASGKTIEAHQHFAATSMGVDVVGTTTNRRSPITRCRNGDGTKVARNCDDGSAFIWRRAFLSFQRLDSDAIEMGWRCGG